MAAYDHLVALRAALGRTGELLRASPDQVPHRVEQLLERVSGLEEQLDVIASKRMGEVAEELAANPEKVGDTSLVVGNAGEMGGNELRQVALGVRDRIPGPALVIVGSSSNGKGSLVAVASKDLVERGINSGEILVQAARKLGGGGSRDPELAQAGGPNGSLLEEALATGRADAGRALARL
jgi:alanyl-tRNA synthetase